MNNRLKESIKLVMPVILIFAFIFAAMRMGPGESNNTADRKDQYPMTRDAFLLDTFCSITLYEGGGDKALTAAVERLSEYDELMNPSKEQSDIYRINHRTEPVVKISDETGRMLEKIIPVDSSADGDLNTAVKPLTELWDFKEKKEVPSEELIIKARSEVSVGNWTVRKAEDGYVFEAFDDKVRIDAGSYAKGFIADEIRDFLKENGVGSAVINLGGNIQCLGKKPDGNPFIIGLREPVKGSDRYLKKLDIDNESVVTAGIYERYFEKDGVHYHHILDPHTGYPVQNELAAVTVVGPDSMYCDALSTALFIKGEARGVEYLKWFNKEYGADQYKAFFIDKDTHIAYTEGAEKLVHN